MPTPGAIRVRGQTSRPVTTDSNDWKIIRMTFLREAPAVVAKLGKQMVQSAYLKRNWGNGVRCSAVNASSTAYWVISSKNIIGGNQKRRPLLTLPEQEDKTTTYTKRWIEKKSGGEAALLTRVFSPLATAVFTA